MEYPTRYSLIGWAASKVGSSPTSSYRPPRMCGLPPTTGSPRTSVTAPIRNRKGSWKTCAGTRSRIWRNRCGPKPRSPQVVTTCSWMCTQRTGPRGTGVSRSTPAATATHCACLLSNSMWNEKCCRSCHLCGPKSVHRRSPVRSIASRVSGTPRPATRYPTGSSAPP